MTMTAESTDLSVPTKSSLGRLVASAATPPKWNDSWMKYIPLIGGTMVTGMNSTRYHTTLEQNADLIASDLANSESPWIGTSVGVIDGAK
jgi:hypothetical protein